MELTGLKAVLLDVDGTLLNSNDEQAKSWLVAFKEAGFELTYADVRSRIGKGGDKVTLELCGLQPDDPLAKSLSTRNAEVFKSEYLSSVKPTEGARALLERLHENGHRLIIATSASGDMLDLLLRKAGVYDLIEKGSTSTDVSNSKPDADLIHAALDRAGLSADQVVMLGDTPYDIEAARKAGVRAIALRCGGWWNDAALGGAVAIFDSPAAMLEELGI